MKCRFCMEEVQEGALKCKHCGSMLNSSGNEVIEEASSVVEMKFCSGCGKKIHKTSSSCPHCGNQQNENVSTQQSAKKIGYAITSLVLGVITFLAVFGNSSWNKDSINGGIFFCVLGVVFGAITLSKKYSGKGMAIAGLVLSILSFFSLVGMLSKFS